MPRNFEPKFGFSPMTPHFLRLCSHRMSQPLCESYTRIHYNWSAPPPEAPVCIDHVTDTFRSTSPSGAMFTPSLGKFSKLLCK